MVNTYLYIYRLYTCDDDDDAQYGKSIKYINGKQCYTYLLYTRQNVHSVGELLPTANDPYVIWLKISA